jgi:hypothetical protein
MAIDRLFGWCEAPKSGYLPWCWPSRYLVDQISYKEVCLYQDEFIWFQSDYGDCACSCRRVSMSDGDGMDSINRVLIVKCAQVPMVVLLCHALNIATSWGSGSSGAYPTLENPRCGCRGPGCVSRLGLRIKLVGLIGNKILVTHGYRNGGKWWVRITPRSSSF